LTTIFPQFSERKVALAFQSEEGNSGQKNVPSERSRRRYHDPLFESRKESFMHVEVMARKRRNRKNLEQFAFISRTFYSDSLP
jgi:hypothetical protein